MGTLALAAGVLAILLAILADEIGVGDQPGRVVEEATEPVPGERPDDRA